MWSLSTNMLTGYALGFTVELRTRWQIISFSVIKSFWGLEISSAAAWKLSIHELKSEPTSWTTIEFLSSSLIGELLVLQNLAFDMVGVETFRRTFFGEKEALQCFTLDCRLCLCKSPWNSEPCAVNYPYAVICKSINDNESNPIL